MRVTVPGHDFHLLRQLGEVAGKRVAHLDGRSLPDDSLRQHPGKVLPGVPPPGEKQRYALPLPRGHNPGSEQPRALRRTRRWFFPLGGVGTGPRQRQNLHRRIVVVEHFALGCLADQLLESGPNHFGSFRDDFPLRRGRLRNSQTRLQPRQPVGANPRSYTLATRSSPPPSPRISSRQHPPALPSRKCHRTGYRANVPTRRPWPSAALGPARGCAAAVPSVRRPCLLNTADSDLRASTRRARSGCGGLPICHRTFSVVPRFRFLIGPGGCGGTALPSGPQIRLLQNFARFLRARFRQ